MGDRRVWAVVVAWNRAALLTESLDALAAQTRPLDGVVVVDNASTDGTAEVIRTHGVVSRVVTMPQNMGGAGGFAAGLAAAVVEGADLVWIMDDDTVATPTALEVLMQARCAYPGTPALLAARADWTDGREHPMNAPRRRPWSSCSLREHARRVGARPIRTASFVAILIDSRAVREDGLPLADFFLWNDDFEYTGRLLRHRVGLYVPAARVEHRTKVFGNSTADPGPRFVNEVRNKIWTFTRTHSFGLLDTCTFSGATLVRWAGMLRRAQDRRGMLRQLAGGVAQALHAPRSTSAVLSGTPVAEQVKAIERGAGRA